jgi:hypothetical protein
LRIVNVGSESKQPEDPKVIVIEDQKTKERTISKQIANLKDSAPLSFDISLPTEERKLARVAKLRANNMLKQKVLEDYELKQAQRLRDL